MVESYLSPEQQQIFEGDQAIAMDYMDLANSKVPELQDAYSTPFDYQDIEDLRLRSEEALMGRLQPYLDRDYDARRTQMLQAGFNPDTEAWDRDMDDFSRRSTDAQLAVIGQSGQEADRNLAVASYLRNLPYNEIQALRSGSPVANPQFPGFAGSQASAADILGAANSQYAADIQKYSNDQASGASLFGGITNLATAAMPYAMGAFTGGAGAAAGAGAASSFMPSNYGGGSVYPAFGFK
jgi:hypothetical protein